MVGVVLETGVAFELAVGLVHIASEVEAGVVLGGGGRGWERGGWEGAWGGWGVIRGGGFCGGGTSTRPGTGWTPGAPRLGPATDELEGTLPTGTSLAMLTTCVVLVLAWKRYLMWSCMYASELRHK